jgi:flagellar M-ring protein FliF
MWENLDKNSKTGLVAGVSILVIITIIAVIYVLSGKNATLFSGLDENEAANIVAALEEMKIPFSIKENGRKILVEEDIVNEVRLKLVSKGVPIKSGVGFELFDNADIGMTEYSQKINYLRAMQGELSRSLMSLEGVKYARVHLVLPEASIFKQKKEKPTASVTLIPVPDYKFDNDQILGMQRLVASSAPGINQNDVIILDNNGVTLSKVIPLNSKENVTSMLLQKKREVERYLEAKANNVLDKTFGVKSSVVTVSVDLIVDKIHRKDEIVLPAGSKNEGVIRKRESLGSSGNDKKSKAPKTLEIEYQLSRRVEEIVSMPGAISRISVGVLLPENTTPNNVNNLRKIISMSVGLDYERGDDLAIYPMKMEFFNKVLMKKKAVSPASHVIDNEVSVDIQNNLFSNRYIIYGTTISSVILLLIVVYLVFTRRRVVSPKAIELSQGDKDKLLADVKQWLGSEAT